MTSYEKPVTEFMSPAVYTVTVDDDISDVSRLLAERRVSCVPVVGRDGKAVGVVSITDLLQIGHIMARSTGAAAVLALPGMCVGDMMTCKVISAPPSATLGAAARTMVENRMNRVFILEDERPVGVCSSRDVMRAVIEERVRAPISEFMASPVATVNTTDPLSLAAERLYYSRLTGLVVLDQSDPAGIFTQVEALAARDRPPSTPVGDVVGYSALSLPLHTPLFRAAAFAAANRARRVLAMDNQSVRGILSGLDFARAATGAR